MNCRKCRYYRLTEPNQPFRTERWCSHPNINKDLRQVDATDCQYYERNDREVCEQCGKKIQMKRPMQVMINGKLTQTTLCKGCEMRYRRGEY